MDNTKMSNGRGRLAEIAEDRGVTVDELVPRTVTETGSVLAAAQALGVAPNTIRYHMLRLGYKARFVHGVVWERETEEGGQS